MFQKRKFSAELTDLTDCNWCQVEINRQWNIQIERYHPRINTEPYHKYKTTHVKYYTPHHPGDVSNHEIDNDILRRPL